MVPDRFSLFRERAFGVRWETWGFPLDPEETGQNSLILCLTTLFPPDPSPTFRNLAGSVNSRENLTLARQRAGRRAECLMASGISDGQI